MPFVEIGGGRREFQGCEGEFADLLVVLKQGAGFWCREAPRDVPF